jgi:acyl carrier protein
MTRDDFRGKLLGYVNEDLLAPGTPAVAVDTNLFDGEYLNSLRILSLLAFVEDLIGREVDDDEIVMDRFASVEAIADSFWTAD